MSAEGCVQVGGEQVEIIKPYSVESNSFLLQCNVKKPVQQFHVDIKRSIREPAEGEPDIPEAVREALQEPPKTAGEAVELMEALAENLGWETGKWACAPEALPCLLCCRHAACTKPLKGSARFVCRLLAGWLLTCRFIPEALLGVRLAPPPRIVPVATAAGWASFLHLQGAPAKPWAHEFVTVMSCH